MILPAAAWRPEKNMASRQQKILLVQTESAPRLPRPAIHCYPQEPGLAGLLPSPQRKEQRKNRMWLFDRTDPAYWQRFKNHDFHPEAQICCDLSKRHAFPKSKQSNLVCLSTAGQSNFSLPLFELLIIARLIVKIWGSAVPSSPRSSWTVNQEMQGLCLLGFQSQ